MSAASDFAPPHDECLPADQRHDQQLDRLRQLLTAIHGRNRFYTRKLETAGLGRDALAALDEVTTLPLTTKQELAADQAASPPWGTAHTEPLDRYCRYHQTSSTTGQPLRWLDTDQSWQWVVDCWRSVFRAARVGREDTIFFPFGFGPFLGFWSAFDAGVQLGALCVPAGGMSSETRLQLLATLRPDVVCCTPTYALRLVEVARVGPASRAAASRRRARS